jgi:hypothetical protein
MKDSRYYSSMPLMRLEKGDKAVIHVNSRNFSFLKERDRERYKNIPDGVYNAVCVSPFCLKCEEYPELSGLYNMHGGDKKGCNGAIYADEPEGVLGICRIQLCFRVGGEEENKAILKKLRNLKSEFDIVYKGEYCVHSCHLPRELALEKGLSTTIADGLKEIFGDKYRCEVTAYNFSEAMINMNSYRIETAKKVNKLVVVSDQAVSNIALELQYFTENRVTCI